MARFFLLLLLLVAIVLELALTGGAFFAPAFTLGKFGVKYGPNTAFLGYLTGWFLLLVSAVAIQAFAWVWQRRPHFAALCYLLGAWWIGIGVGIYVVFGKPDNLVLDSLKGTLLVLLAWRCQGGRMPLRRY
ncbi:hypothetical protein [Hymenobacter sp. PAMC 26628]|uniref:hypothetical protein n=1 Tax=Hymenobacter sp. PAMC 26628 TaxID=1484118 RepID=UPI0007706BD3|nr:hypothetical protein [Hymenobacter sp. PAMC 26628]AMJ66854.1 hypothetical protein AXW84_16530 [Hymenobacter sp. PAMC 26628]